MKTTALRLIASALVLLAACADEPAVAPDLPVDPRAAVLDAMAASYEIGTMHQEFRMEMSAGAESFTFTGEADVDNDRQRARMSMDLGMLGGTMDMIVDGTVIYMRTPAFEEQVPTEWVSMDPSKMDPAVAAQFGGGGGMTDPSAYIGLFAGVVDVEAVGQEEIGGVTTTHYEGTIDLKRVLEQFPAVLGEDVNRAQTEALEQTLDQFETLGIDGRIPFQIWIDEDGLPRRQAISMDFGEMVPGVGSASMDIRVDFSAFGEPVRVDLPKPSEVTDMTDVIAMTGGSG